MTPDHEATIRAPVGDGAELFDDRALFYLQNRALIEKWAGLRFDASQAAGRWLETLFDQIADLNGDWASWSGIAGKYRALFLCPVAAVGDGPPGVGIGLAWNDTGVQPDKKGDSTSPFVGIRVNPDIGEALLPFLDRLDGGNNHGYAVSSNWPRYRYITADARWWEHLDDYRAGLIEAARSVVGQYVRALDEFASTRPRL